MHDHRDPLLFPVRIADLRPTQLTVGLREVAQKRRHWRESYGKKADRFLGTHLIPVVIGPKRINYIVDHHHLARALHDEGVRDVLTSTVADLSQLDEGAFWFNLENRNWTHPFDAKGRKRDVSELPKTIDALVDDPYRSLAGELRQAGGYAKDDRPFVEFLWADFLRRRIKSKRLKNNFDECLKDAILLARSPDANYLPGWCGPSDTSSQRTRK